MHKNILSQFWHDYCNVESPLTVQCSYMSGQEFYNTVITVMLSRP